MFKHELLLLLVCLQLITINKCYFYTRTIESVRFAINSYYTYLTGVSCLISRNDLRADTFHNEWAATACLGRVYNQFEITLWKELTVILLFREVHGLITFVDRHLWNYCGELFIDGAMGGSEAFSSRPGARTTGGVVGICTSWLGR